MDYYHERLPSVEFGTCVCAGVVQGGGIDSLSRSDGSRGRGHSEQIRGLSRFVIGRGQRELEASGFGETGEGVGVGMVIPPG